MTMISKTKRAECLLFGHLNGLELGSRRMRDGSSAVIAYHSGSKWLRAFPSWDVLHSFLNWNVTKSMAGYSLPWNTSGSPTRGLSNS
jgi:hypothetical protein